MANSIIKYITTDNKPVGLWGATFKDASDKDASSKVLTVISNEYVESEGCCIITLSGELSSVTYLFFYANAEITDTITSVILPEGLKYIGKRCFNECKNLRSVEIPSTIEKIEKEAFVDCASLVKLTFKGAVPPNAYGAFLGVGRYGVLYRPSGAVYSTVMNSVNPDNPNDYVIKDYKLSNYGWVERGINKNAIEPTLSVNRLPTSIYIERYIDIIPVTNSDGVINIIVNDEKVGSVNNGDTYSLQIPNEGTNTVVIQIEATDSYEYYTKVYDIEGVMANLDFTVEGNPNYVGNQLSITPTSNSDSAIVIEYIKDGSSTIIGTCHTGETIQWIVQSAGKYSIKCSVEETAIYNYKSVTKEYEASEKEHSDITIEVEGYDLNGEKTNESYFKGFTLKMYAYRNGSAITDLTDQFYVNDVVVEGYEYKVTEAGELNIKVVIPDTDTSYGGTAFTTVYVDPDLELEPNTLRCNLTKKYLDGNFYTCDTIAISGLGGGKTMRR